MTSEIIWLFLKMLSIRLLFVVTICYQNVLCSKKLCDMEDFECLTAAAKRVKPFSDAKPLHVDLIKADLPTVKYTITDTTLSGINTCSPELLKINTKNLTYIYHLACQHLTMQGLYEIDGNLGPMAIEGKGDFKVEYDDYVFIIDGEFDTFVVDNKIHNHIKTFNFEIDAKGKVIYDFKNLFNGDTEKAAALQKYVRENGQTVNKILRRPVMEKFVAQIIEKMNAYLAKVSVEELFTVEWEI